MKQFEVYYRLTFESSMIVEAENKTSAREQVEELNGQEHLAKVDVGFLEVEAVEAEERP